MAGIGFELQKLSLRGGVSAPFLAIGHGAVIAAGPWMFTILAIALINLVTARGMGLAALADFRGLLIYAFALSLFLTAPVVIIATRMVSDAIYSRKFHLVSSIFFASLTISALIAGICTSLLYVLVLKLEPETAFVGTLTCILVSMIWIAHAFCSAVRDYNGITIAFVTGLVTAVAGAIWATSQDLQTAGLIWTFNIGLVVTLFGLTSRVFITFPAPVMAPRDAFYLFGEASRAYWYIGLGAFVSVMSIWIDKWIMWLGPAGERLPNGLLHAPLYDSAMFAAYLVIIPSLSLFVVDLETAFFVRYQRYYTDIREHATLAQISENLLQLKRQVYRSLRRIFIVQAALCMILVLVSPLIIEAFGMQYRQTAIYRFGVLGTLFQFMFLACSSLLLFFNRTRWFLGLQVLFLSLNTLLALGSIHMGPDYYGFGYLIACVISSLASFLALQAALDDLNAWTFLSTTAKNEDGKWLSGLPDQPETL